MIGLLPSIFCSGQDITDPTATAVVMVMKMTGRPHHHH